MSPLPLDIARGVKKDKLRRRAACQRTLCLESRGRKGKESEGPPYSEKEKKGEDACLFTAAEGGGYCKKRAPR